VHDLLVAAVVGSRQIARRQLRQAHHLGQAVAGDECPAAQLRHRLVAQLRVDLGGGVRQGDGDLDVLRRWQVEHLAGDAEGVGPHARREVLQVAEAQHLVAAEAAHDRVLVAEPCERPAPDPDIEEPEHPVGVHRRVC
jgi:hypothetical protein